MQQNSFSLGFGISLLSTQYVPTVSLSLVQSSAQLLVSSSRQSFFTSCCQVVKLFRIYDGKKYWFNTAVNMTSIGVSLEPIEDRFSIVLSRLERIEASLSGLEDVKKLLMKIEDNTHADDDGNSDFRHNWQEKVGFEIYLKQIGIALS